MVLNRAIAAQIRDVLEQNPQGLSITDIVKKTKTNRNTVGRYLENMLVSGHVEMHHLGMAKIYAPAHRVPVSAVLSLSSELIMQLDTKTRIVFVNEAFSRFLKTSVGEISGKNLQFTAVVPVFERQFEPFLARIKSGLEGTEWHGVVSIPHRDTVFSCRVAPTVLDDGQKGVSVILEDITEQRRAEEKLKESEARYRLISEASRDLIFVIGRDDTIEYVNGFAARSIGTNPDEIIGRSRDSFFSPQVSQHQKKKIDHVFSTGIPSRSEGELRLNGETRWFDHFLMPVFGANGKVQSVFGVSRDISGRKRAEDSLRESEARYRLLLQRSFDAVIIHHNGFVTLANDAAARLFGAPSAQAMVGADIMDHIHPDSKELIRKRMAEMKAGTGTAVDIREEKFQRPDGSVFYVEVAAMGFLDHGVPAVQVLFRDITKKKELTYALQQSEEKYRMLVEHSQTGVFILQGSVIQYANAALARMLGTIPEALLLQDIREFVAPEDQGWVIERALLRQQGEPVPGAYECTLIKRDGKSRIFVSLDAGLIQYRNKPACMGTVRDITGQKATEDALREHEERLEAIFEESPLAMATLGQDLMILLVNPRFTTVLGTPKKALEARTFRELVHEQDLGKFNEAFSRIERGEVPGGAFTARLRCGDGMYRGFEVIPRVLRKTEDTVLEYYAEIRELPDRTTGSLSQSVLPRNH